MLNHNKALSMEVPAWDLRKSATVRAFRMNRQTDGWMSGLTHGRMDRHGAFLALPEEKNVDETGKPVFFT